ncbi:MAG TPA: AAA family ATPase [Ktedonobacterales bacterium]
MAQVTPIVRVFFSSTFADFQHERNILQARVFPAMRQYCLERGARFLPIDLRWGISLEAGVEQYVVRACLDEIQRCRQTSPHFNFVAMLGDRYGSLLVPETIPESDYNLLVAALKPAGRALVEAWYQRDTNNVPSVYALKPRNASWDASVSERLQAALSAGCARTRVSAATRLACTASVTEQEIEAGIFAQPGLARPLVLRRTLRGGPAPAAYREQLATSRRKLDQLHRRLRSALGAEYLTYSARVSGGSLAEDTLGDFAQLVQRQLIQRVDATLEELGRERQSRNDLRSWSFARDRLEHFTGQENARDYLRSYFAAPASTPMVVTGESGIGKTTLLLKAAEDARQAHSGRLELTYFIGGSTAIATIPDLIGDIERQLLDAYPDPPGLETRDQTVVPASAAEREARLPDFLARATPGRPLTLVVDALDQLRADPLREGDIARWVPHTLPANVWMLVSLLPGAEADQLRASLPLGALLTVQPLAVQQGEELFSQWLGEHGRELTSDQRATVTAYFAAHPNPLGLRVIAEMARRWRSWDTATPTLAPTVPGLITQLLEDLEKPARHGEPLVKHSLGLIAAGKQGLTEDETLGAISQQRELVRQITTQNPYAPDATALPAVLWARVYGDLEWALTERDVDRARVLTFYHRQVSEAVRARYLAPEALLGWRRRLAIYFGRRPGHTPYLVNTADRPRAVVNERMVSELLYQQVNGQTPADAKRTVLDGEFLQARIQVVKTTAALEDLDAALRADPDVQLLSDTLELSQPVLDALPQELPNQIWGRSPRLFHMMRRWAAWDDPHFHLDSPTLRQPLTAGEIEMGHTHAVTMCAFAPTGHQVVSASRDKSLRIWNPPGPEEPATSWVSVKLQGHTDAVRCCAFDPTGNWIVSGSDDMTVRLWDTEGRLLRTWDEHTGAVQWVAFSPNGAWLASASADRSVHLYRRINGSDTPYAFDRPLTGHTGAVNRCAFSVDSALLASVADDKTARVWDLSGAIPPVVLEGHDGRVTTCLFTQNPTGGALLVTGSADRTLRVWSQPFRSGRSATLSGHTDRINDCALNPVAPNIVVSGGEDGWLRVWDVTSLSALQSFDSQRNGAHACAFTPDGVTVVAATWGNVGLLWDWASGKPADALTGHGAGLNSCAVSPDGALAITGSADKSVRVWDLRVADRKQALAAALGKQEDIIRSCAISADGEYSVRGTTNGWMTLESVQGHATLHHWQAHEKCVRGCAFSPDGATILSGSEDGSLRLWRRDAEEHAEYLGHESHVRCCAFNPNGEEFLSGGGEFQNDCAMRLWKLGQPEPVELYTGWEQLVIDCRFSPDGNTFYGASYDNTVRAWDRGAGRQRMIYEGPRHPAGVVRAMGISHDGSRLAVVDKFGKVIILDLAHGRPPITFSAHNDYANTCRFTADDRYLLCCSSDGAVSVWDLETLQQDAPTPTLTWRGNNETLVCMAFDDRNGRLCVAENDALHTLTLVNLPTTTPARPMTVTRASAPAAPPSAKRPWWSRSRR